MDSNHRNPKMTDLQSVPFNHSGTYPWMPRARRSIVIIATFRQAVKRKIGANSLSLCAVNHRQIIFRQIGRNFGKTCRIFMTQKRFCAKMSLIFLLQKEQSALGGNNNEKKLLSDSCLSCRHGHLPCDGHLHVSPCLRQRPR